MIKGKQYFHFVLFLLLLILLFFSRSTGKPLFQSDSFTYMATAQAMEQGQWYLEMWGRVPLQVPPLYPMLIALGENWFGQETANAAFLISVLSSTLLIPLVFIWAGFRLGWVWSWAAVILVVFNASLILYGLNLLTESLFTLLFFASVGLSWVILRGQRHPILWLVVGILMGLTILTKSSGWILPGVLILWIGFQVIRSRLSLRKTLYGALALIAGVLIVTQPITRAHPIPGGGGEFSGKKSLVSWLAKPDLRGSGISREQYFCQLTSEGDQFKVEVSPGGNLKELLRTQGKEVVSTIFVNTALAFQGLSQLVPWWLLIWIPGGVTIQWLKRDAEGIRLSIYLCAICLGLIEFYAIAGAFTSAVGPERYAVPLIPVLILWAVIGLRDAYRVAQESWETPMPWIRPAGIGLVVLLMSLTVYPVLSQGKGIFFLPEEKRWTRSDAELIGTWLQRNFGSQRKIMVRDPSIPYYAEGYWVLTPLEPLDRIVRFAQVRGVQLMIVRRPVEGERRPQLRPLLEKGYRYPGLTRVFGITNRNDPSQLDVAIFTVSAG